jgi:Zn-finger nucleic acid-binding protein
MRCPSCRKALLILEIEGVEVDTCVDGHGLWLDRQELSQLFLIAGVPHQLKDLTAWLEVLPHQHARRRCPRCRSRMDEVRAPGIVDDVILDQCPHGDGLWFDQGELSALLGAALGCEDAAIERVQDFLGQVAQPSHEGVES